MNKPRNSGKSNKKKSKQVHFRDDMIYFEGKVVETFPGTVFGIEISRKNDLPPLFAKCGLKALLIKKRVRIIKGDKVRVEINPEDIGSNNTLKGLIVERLNTPAPHTQSQNSN